MDELRRWKLLAASRHGTWLVAFHVGGLDQHAGVRAHLDQFRALGLAAVSLRPLEFFPRHRLAVDAGVFQLLEPCYGLLGANEQSGRLGAARTQRQAGGDSCQPVCGIGYHFFGGSCLRGPEHAREFSAWGKSAVYDGFAPGSGAPPLRATVADHAGYKRGFCGNDRRVRQCGFEARATHGHRAYGDAGHHFNWIPASAHVVREFAQLSWLQGIGRKFLGGSARIFFRGAPACASCVRILFVRSERILFFAQAALKHGTDE